MENFKKKRSPFFRKKKEKEIFNFPTAVQHLIDGKNISKKEWEDENIFGSLKNGELIIRNEGNIDNTWVLSEGDLTGEDWFVVDEK